MRSFYLLALLILPVLSGCNDIPPRSTIPVERKGQEAVKEDQLSPVLKGITKVETLTLALIRGREGAKVRNQKSQGFINSKSMNFHVDVQDDLGRINGFNEEGNTSINIDIDTNVVRFGGFYPNGNMSIRIQKHQDLIEVDGFIGDTNMNVTVQSKGEVYRLIGYKGDSNINLVLENSTSVSQALAELILPTF